MLITCMIIVSVPILNSMFIAFSPSPERYARWLFMMVLLEALATAKVIENLQDYRKTTQVRKPWITWTSSLLLVYGISYAMGGL